jgi:hypothetical protein
LRSENGLDVDASGASEKQCLGRGASASAVRGRTKLARLIAV